MLGTKVKCPRCGDEDYKELKSYDVIGYDPLMIEVQCQQCKLKYKVAPPPWYREGEPAYD